MSFPLGADVLVPARVVALYGAGRAPEFAQVSLQLGDGQHLITHPDNCRPTAEAPGSSLLAPGEEKAQEPVEDKAQRAAHNKSLRPHRTKSQEPGARSANGVSNG